ncbi:hypothetical protein T09_1112 [Trichinella sp. T9]|nr:hypothetical protein T09_15649 [Trichinella sp. T9]KRX58978.1 hypothetical protein T09_1112 [Trichinella sp. T9]
MRAGRQRRNMGRKNSWLLQYRQKTPCLHQPKFEGGSFLFKFVWDQFEVDDDHGFHNEEIRVHCSKYSACIGTDRVTLGTQTVALEQCPLQGL